MNIKLFFERNLNLGKRLIRLHHSNAVLFYLLSLTGLLLFSSAFRSAFPATRVMLKDVHIWLGVLSCLPLLFYLPHMKKHMQTISQKRQNQLNVKAILAILLTLIISGFILAFHTYIPPVINSFALVVHGLATWVGVPYAIYHSITRSKWFKNMEKRLRRVELKDQPIQIDERNPVYKRRTFLRLLSGTLIGLMFVPTFGKWLNQYLPKTNQPKVSNQNFFTPTPEPDIKSSPPIGGGKKGEFRYYTVTEVPTLTNENWSFTIDGLVDQPLTYNWTQFLQLKRNVQVSDFHCVTGWSVFAGTWEGIPLKTMLDKAGLKEKAAYLKFYSADGVYTSGISLAQAMDDDVMVAVLLDGELITQNNGGPVRVIIPKMYAYKSVKWLSRIEVIDKEYIGFWEKRGYAQDAWVNL